MCCKCRASDDIIELKCFKEDWNSLGEKWYVIR